MSDSSTHWQEAAIEDLKESNLSVAEIGAKYGRSASTIKKLRSRSKIVRTIPIVRKGPKNKEFEQPISRAHHSIGLKINIARGNDRATDFANKLGVSFYVLSQMEKGHHDFKLSELVRISVLTGMEIEDLMKSYDKNIYQQKRSVHGPS